MYWADEVIILATTQVHVYSIIHFLGKCKESSQCPDGEFCYIPKRKLEGVCRRKIIAPAYTFMRQITLFY